MVQQKSKAAQQCQLWKQIVSCTIETKALPYGIYMYTNKVIFSLN